MSERLEVAWCVSVAILVVTSMIIVGSVALVAPTTAQSGSSNAPQITDTGADQPRTTPEDTNLSITGITVADGDNSDSNTGDPVVMEAQFDVTDGTVDLANTNADVLSGSDGSAAVTINGTVAEINISLSKSDMEWLEEPYEPLPVAGHS